MKTKPKAIIFDLGAVLINLDFSRTVEHFLAHVPNLDREVFLGKDAQLSLYNGFETGKLKTDELIERFNEHHGSQVSKEIFTNAWNAMILDFPPEKIKLLERLKNQGTDLYLLSNINELHAEAAQKSFARLALPYPFHSLFKKVYYSHEIGMRKPDAEVFLHILKQNYLHPHEVLFIDDTLQHIQSARTLGIHTIHLENPNSLLKLIEAFI